MYIILNIYTTYIWSHVQFTSWAYTFEWTFELSHQGHLNPGHKLCMLDTTICVVVPCTIILWKIHRYNSNSYVIWNGYKHQHNIIIWHVGSYMYNHYCISSSVHIMPCGKSTHMSIVALSSFSVRPIVKTTLVGDIKVTYYHNPGTKTALLRIVPWFSTNPEGGHHINITWRVIVCGTPINIPVANILRRPQYNWLSFAVQTVYTIHYKGHICLFCVISVP